MKYYRIFRFIPFELRHPTMFRQGLYDSFRFLRDHHKLPLVIALKYANVHRNNM